MVTNFVEEIGTLAEETKRKTRFGRVVSDKMDKTVVVAVDMLKRTWIICAPH